MIAQQHGVRGYPTIILKRPDGTEIDRIPTFLSPDSLVMMINDYVEGRGTLDDLKHRFAESPDSLDLLFQIAEKYQYRGQDAMAESCYAEVVGADPGNRKDFAARALHSMALVAYSAHEAGYDSAVARFEAVTERYPKTEWAQDAYTWVPYIMARQERYTEALEWYQAFLKEYPDSPEVDWVHRQIEDIRSKMP